MNKSFRWSLWALLSFSLLFTACDKEPDTVVAIDKEEFTVEDQSTIATNLSYLIDQTVNYYEVLDTNQYEAFYTYINSIFTSVVNTNPVETRKDFDWNVFVLKDDNLKTTFGIPGGKVYITTGMLKSIQSENELFSILAHEVYYIDQGVALATLKAEYGALVLGDLILGTNSTAAIDMAETIYTLKYSNEQVMEADQFVVDLICPFQYEARGLKSYIEYAMLSEESVDWLEYRPGGELRIGAINNAASDCGFDEQRFVERYDDFKSLLP